MIFGSFTYMTILSTNVQMEIDFIVLIGPFMFIYLV